MLGLYFNQQFNWCCKKQLSSFRLAMFTANKCDHKVAISHFHCLLPEQATIQADLC